MNNFIVFLIAAIFFTSCDSISGNGNIISEKRSIYNVHSIKTSGSIDIDINIGDGYSLVVENDENLIPHIVTEVNNGVLNIHYKNNYSIVNDHAKVTVTVPSLNKISTSGSADIKGHGVIISDKEFDITTSGSGDIDLEVDAPAISAVGSGSGDIALSGKTKDLDCKISGSGDVKCSNLKSENTNIRLSGSSAAHVFASVSLKVNVAGSGDVYYSGNPTSPEIHISGSGTVKSEK
ncbi:MAG: head GIN domain-containing protein [Ginsengibacter sp.]